MNHKNERVIYIKDMLFAVLYRWRAVLIVALVLVVLTIVLHEATSFRCEYRQYFGRKDKKYSKKKIKMLLTNRRTADTIIRQNKEG